jgi:hypothetical protein
MSALSERFRPSVIVILTPAARRIDALLRARDLDVTGLLAAVDRLRHRPENPRTPTL